MFIFVFALCANPAVSGNQAPAGPDRLPRLAPVTTFTLHGAPGRIRSMGDLQILRDGRVVMIDIEARRVSVFGADGRFERLLALPGAISPENEFISRLAALPDGGLVIADGQGNRFLFYDAALDPGPVVPFGISLSIVHDFVRHPSGDLLIAACGAQDDKVFHRFDRLGRHLRSSVQQPPLPGPGRGAWCGGSLAVDPADGTLWMSFLMPYEILHLSLDDDVLDRIVREMPGMLPSDPDLTREKTPTRFRGNFSGSARVAVIGGFVVNSYLLDVRKRMADVFTRGGRAIALGLGDDSPLSFARHAGDHLFVRHVSGADVRIETWEEIVDQPREGLK
jgi:hypothetical protein